MANSESVTSRALTFAQAFARRLAEQVAPHLFHLTLFGFRAWGDNGCSRSHRPNAPSESLQRRCHRQRSLLQSSGCVGRSKNDVVKTRIVPDVNVYISGLLWTGTPHQILQAAEAGALTSLTTSTIIEELREMLDRPKLAKRLSALTTSSAVYMKPSTLRRKYIQPDQEKLDWAKHVLGVKTDTDALDRALDIMEVTPWGYPCQKLLGKLAPSSYGRI